MEETNKPSNLLEESNEMNDLLEKIKQKKIVIEEIKVEYDTFKKNNPQDTIALPSDKLDELHKIEKKMNDSAKQANIMVDLYARTAISAFERLLINKEGAKARPIKIELNDSMLNMMPLVQRFVYRCIEKYGPNSASKSAPVDKKRELMEAWFKNLFSNSSVNARLTYDETLWPPTTVEYGSIVLLRCQVSRVVDYYIFEINLNKPLNECVRIYSTPSGIVGGEYNESLNIFNVEYLITNHE